MGKKNNPRYELHTFPYEAVERESEKGIQIRFSDVKEEWFPKSQIEIDEGTQQVTIPAWLAEDKQLM